MQWNGPWSERSWEWDSLSDRDKELLSVRVRNEGEFWMSFDDFAKQFSHLDLVSSEQMTEKICLTTTAFIMSIFCLLIFNRIFGSFLSWHFDMLSLSLMPQCYNLLLGIRLVNS